ncbi:MAG: TetR family transcriptional regulator [Rhodococcus sp.]|nr:TetR family transcriptional regulator [Rhodococcus sp. (in: high G+C Gram-positive bacteria)]
MNSPVDAPRKRDPERRRQELLDAATAIIVARGSAALTHRAAATRADLALGTATKYFPSIDELREAALRELERENEEALDAIEHELDRLTPGADLAEVCAALMHRFLCDIRQVRASMAISTTAISDERLRSLAMRWTDRLVEILARHISRERAVIAETFLNGAMMHAALHAEPLTETSVTNTLHAIFTMSESR